MDKMDNGQNGHFSEKLCPFPCFFPKKIVTSQGETLPDHDEVFEKPETRKLKIWQRRKKRPGIKECGFSSTKYDNGNIPKLMSNEIQSK